MSIKVQKYNIFKHHPCMVAIVDFWKTSPKFMNIFKAYKAISQIPRLVAEPDLFLANETSNNFQTNTQ